MISFSNYLRLSLISDSAQNGWTLSDVPVNVCEHKYCFGVFGVTAMSRVCRGQSCYHKTFNRFNRINWCLGILVVAKDFIKWSVTSILLLAMAKLTLAGFRKSVLNQVNWRQQAGIWGSRIERITDFRAWLWFWEVRTGAGRGHGQFSKCTYKCA